MRNKHLTCNEHINIINIICSNVAILNGITTTCRENSISCYIIFENKYDWKECLSHGESNNLSTLKTVLLLLTLLINIHWGFPLLSPERFVLNHDIKLDMSLSKQATSSSTSSLV